MHFEFEFHYGFAYVWLQYQFTRGVRKKKKNSKYSALLFTGFKFTLRRHDNMACKRARFNLTKKRKLKIEKRKDNWKIQTQQEFKFSFKGIEYSFIFFFRNLIYFPVVVGRIGNRQKKSMQFVKSEISYMLTFEKTTTKKKQSKILINTKVRRTKNKKMIHNQRERETEREKFLKRITTIECWRDPISCTIICLLEHQCCCHCYCCHSNLNHWKLKEKKNIKKNCAICCSMYMFSYFFFVP